MHTRLRLCALLLPTVLLFGTTGLRAGIVFYSNEVDFNNAIGAAGLAFVAQEDFESSTLGPGMILEINDPMQAGVPNGPFPTGLNGATSLLRIQTNTTGTGDTLLPRGGTSLSTVSASFNGAPSDALYTTFVSDGLDLIFLPGSGILGLSLSALFDSLGDLGTISIRVFDTTETELGSATLNDVGVAGSFLGFTVMPGQDIGRIYLAGAGVGSTSPDCVFGCGAGGGGGGLGGIGGLGNTGVDNLRVYQAGQSMPMPEPSSLTLLGLGLAGLGLHRRRQPGN